MSKKIVSFFYFIVLRITGISCKYSEVCNGIYENMNQENADRETFLNSTLSGDILLSSYQNSTSELEARRNRIFDKGNTLLKIAAFAIPVVGFLSTFDVNIYLYIAILCLLFISIVMLIYLVQLAKYHQPTIDKDDLIKYSDDEKFKKSFAYDTYICNTQNNLVVDYLADIFRSSYRTLSISLLLVFVLLIINFSSSVNGDVHLTNTNEEANSYPLRDIEYYKHDMNQHSTFPVDSIKTNGTISQDSTHTN